MDIKLTRVPKSPKSRSWGNWEMWGVREEQSGWELPPINKYIWRENGHIRNSEVSNKTIHAALWAPGPVASIRGRESLAGIAISEDNCDVWVAGHVPYQVQAYGKTRTIIQFRLMRGSVKVTLLVVISTARGCFLISPWVYWTTYVTCIDPYLGTYALSILPTPSNDNDESFVTSLSDKKIESWRGCRH